MQKISENLYQFTTYIPPMDFTIHQYLLAVEPAIIFAAGTLKEAEKNLPEIIKILNGRSVKYIFVSHMESDECGGLSVFLKEYPDVIVLCSSLCARELPSYGYNGKIKICSENAELEDGALQLQFIDYPAEVHLQNGLICLEHNSGVFYSADLMLRNGNGTGQIINSEWKTEVNNISLERIPNEGRLLEMKEKLLALAPRLIIVGHGFCVTV